MINDEQAVVLTSGCQRIATEVKNKKTGNSLEKRETVLDSKQLSNNQEFIRIVRVMRINICKVTEKQLSFFQTINVHQNKKKSF